MHERKELVKHGGAVVQGSFHLLSVMCLDLRQDVVDCQAAVATICVLRRRPVLEVVMFWLHSSTSPLRFLPGAEERPAASFLLILSFLVSASFCLPSSMAQTMAVFQRTMSGRLQDVSAELWENLTLKLILLTICWVAMPFIFLLEKWPQNHNLILDDQSTVHVCRHKSARTTVYLEN